jgi:hypothetical protein
MNSRGRTKRKKVQLTERLHADDTNIGLGQTIADRHEEITLGVRTVCLEVPERQSTVNEVLIPAQDASVQNSEMGITVPAGEKGAGMPPIDRFLPRTTTSRTDKGSFHGQGGTDMLSDAQRRELRRSRRGKVDVNLTEGRHEEAGESEEACSPDAGDTTLSLQRLTTSETTLNTFAYGVRKYSLALSCMNGGAPNQESSGYEVHGPQTGTVLVVCGRCGIVDESNRRLTLLDCSQAFAHVIADHYYTCHRSTSSEVRCDWLPSFHRRLSYVRMSYR